MMKTTVPQKNEPNHKPGPHDPAPTPVQRTEPAVASAPVGHTQKPDSKEERQRKLEAARRLEVLGAGVGFDVPDATTEEEKKAIDKANEERIDEINKNRKILGLAEDRVLKDTFRLNRERRKEAVEGPKKEWNTADSDR